MCLQCLHYHCPRHWIWSNQLHVFGRMERKWLLKSSKNKQTKCQATAIHYIGITLITVLVITIFTDEFISILICCLKCTGEKTRPIHRFFKWKCAKHGIVLIIMCTGENKYQIKYNFSRVNSVYTEKKRVVQREDNQKFPDAYYEKWDGCSPNVILCKQLINSFVTHCIVCCVYIFFRKASEQFQSVWIKWRR